MNKIKVILSALLMTVLFISGNGVTLASSEVTFQDAVKDIPENQKEIITLLNKAIAEGKKQQTDEFLESKDGLKLQEYLSENTDLGYKLIESSEAYRFLASNNNKINKSITFNDGSYINVENFTREIKPSKNKNIAYAYGTKVYEHTNRVSYGWITGSAYVQIITSYQLERNGVDVKITKVKPSATANGVGAYASYNGDAKSNNNETGDAYASASFQVGMTVPYDSTDTVWLFTRFNSQRPYNDNEGALPKGK